MRERRRSWRRRGWGEHDMNTVFVCEFWHWGTGVLWALTASHFSVGHSRRSDKAIRRKLWEWQKELTLPDRSRHLTFKMLKPFKKFSSKKSSFNDESLVQDWWEEGVVTLTATLSMCRQTLSACDGCDKFTHHCGPRWFWKKVRWLVRELSALRA